MIIVFKPHGTSKADIDLTLKIEKYLFDNPNVKAISVKSGIVDIDISYIFPIPKLTTGESLKILGQGNAYVILANLIFLFEQDVPFIIKKDYFNLSGYSIQQTYMILEELFGKDIWEV